MTTDPTPTGTCAGCKQPIARGAEYWGEVTGWEQKRSVGGTNTIALRKRTGRVVCSDCMRRRKAGIPAGQGRMV